MYIRQQTLGKFGNIITTSYVYKLIDQSSVLLVIYLYKLFCKFWVIHESIRVYNTRQRHEIS